MAIAAIIGRSLLKVSFAAASTVSRLTRRARSLHGSMKIRLPSVRNARWILSLVLLLGTPSPPSSCSACTIIGSSASSGRLVGYPEVSPLRVRPVKLARVRERSLEGTHLLRNRRIGNGRASGIIRPTCGEPRRSIRSGQPAKGLAKPRVDEIPAFLPGPSAAADEGPGHPQVDEMLL